jgi:hypothetical protein
MGRENAAHSLNSRIKSVIYVENANSNNCVPTRRKNFSFMSDDTQNSADTTHAAGGQPPLWAPPLMWPLFIVN